MVHIMYLLIWHTCNSLYGTHIIILMWYSFTPYMVLVKSLDDIHLLLIWYSLTPYIVHIEHVYSSIYGSLRIPYIVHKPYFKTSRVFLNVNITLQYTQTSKVHLEYIGYWAVFRHNLSTSRSDVYVAA